MVSVQPAEFERDPSWVKYFRFYAKDLRESKKRVKFNQHLHFECQMCGICCDFASHQHRCLLSWGDVAQWHAAGFDLGLFFVFPAHSIDGFSALGIPTKGELKSGKFSEWIRALDERHLLSSKLPRLMQLLSTNLGNPNILNIESGECLYLGSDHRCLIHPIRPGACHLFPYLQSKIVQITSETPSNFNEEMSVPCPPSAFTSEDTFPEDTHQIIRDCAEAEAAMWAQERVSLPEVENLLVEIWREILPKF